MPRRRLPKPAERWWSWPPPTDRPTAQWRTEEYRGYTCCPSLLGVGPSPRLVADEQWVEAVLVEIVDDVGMFAFWRGFTDLLRACSGELCADQPFPAVEDYPSYQAIIELPLANVACVPADRGYCRDKWTPEMLRAMKHNPVFVGIPPFPALIAQDAWCENITNDDQEDSVVQRFANVLHCLRRSYGCSASPRVQAPLGYVYRGGMFQPADDRV
jgi:hypothetical protein